MKIKPGINRGLALAAFCVLSCAVMPALAQTTAVATGDTVLIPVGSQASDGNLPDRGLSRDAVKSAYGEPQQAFDAVGTPPISRWQYPGFTVYFEGDTVIHSVAAHHAGQTAPTAQ